MKIIYYSLNYSISAIAPAAFKSSTNFSASALGIFSLTVLGAPSTNSLASFNPNPVASLTTLITWILFDPASFNTTLNEDFSSAAPAAAPPATGAAAATADTPYFSSIAFTNSASSATVKLSIFYINSSIILISS